MVIVGRKSDAGPRLEGILGVVKMRCLRIAFQTRKCQTPGKLFKLAKTITVAAILE